MKKKILVSVYTVTVLLFLLLNTACNGISHQNNTLYIEDNTKEFLSDDSFTLQDFDYLVVGKSTFDDLECSFSRYLAYYTQTGLECEFPTKDEKCIRLCFEGPNLVFQSIEIDKSHFPKKVYYDLEDFDDLVIGESTIDDFQKKIGRIVECYVTSFGLMCELPMENGKCITVKFYGSSSVLHSIEVKDYS